MDKLDLNFKKLLSFFVSSFLIVWLGSYTYEAFKIYEHTDNVVKTIFDIPHIFENFLIYMLIDSEMFVLFLMLMVILVTYTTSQSVLILSKKISRLKKFTINKDIAFTLFSIFLSSLYFFFSFSLVTLYEPVAKNPTTNFEIIRPYIKNEEYLLLRSNYLQVNSKDSLMKVLNKTDEIAKTNNLKIKKVLK